MLNPTSITTDKRFLVWGISRSGIHAIASWVYDNHHGNKVFLNDQLYDSELTSSCHPGAYLYNYNQHKLSNRLIFEGDVFSSSVLSIIVFENHDLACGNGDWFCRMIIGCANKCHNVLILRNLYDHYASFISIHNDYKHALPTKRATRNLTSVNGFHLELWKMYAREMIEPKHLPPDTIRVYYDSWIQSSDYRKEIAAKFGFFSNGEAYRKVSHYGGGSSFDGTKFHGCAPQMKLRNRWEQISVTEQSLLLDAISKDEEIQELCDFFR